LGFLMKCTKIFRVIYPSVFPTCAVKMHSWASRHARRLAQQVSLVCGRLYSSIQIRRNVIEIRRVWYRKSSQPPAKFADLYRVSQKKLTPLLFIWISNVSVFFDSPCTGCIKKRRPLEIKPIVKIWMPFQLQYAEPWCVKYWWSAYIRKRRPLEINHCYNLNPGALC
jgi:hypothetical protein